MNHHNLSSSSSSSFLNRAFITISLLLLLRFAPFATGERICSKAAPNNPHTYFKHVKTVLQRLVDGTPNASPTFAMGASEPNDDRGSVAGHATCYTTNPTSCYNCLLSVKETLVENCTDSINGGYYGAACNMQFWEIGSLD
ncbi:hypothetical protein LINPERPRIM_LOCUS32008 [Linum perenne]